MPEEYLGFMEIVLPNEVGSVENLLAGGDTFGCIQNEYLIVRDENGKEIGTYKFNGEKFVEVPYRRIHNMHLGQIKSKNIQQKLAMDMLYDTDTTIDVITGNPGSGKNYITSAVAVDMLEKEIFKKIVYVRNNVEVRNTRPIGFLPGESDDKLLPFAMPLADNLGDVDIMKDMIESGQLEIQPMGFIRGRGFKNSIVICDEAENLTKDLAQLLISRIGENSVLWVIGDSKQVDADVFRKDNGLIRIIEKLKGHPRFGYVRFIETERSETAAMADLLD